jgi:hypothetical protein
MTARTFARVWRLADMDPGEVAFRLRCELRKRWDRARGAISRPSWNRAALRAVLADACPGESLFLASARSAAAAGDWTGTHRALARHVVNRTTPFPLPPASIESLVSRITVTFPAAERDSAARAGRILDGCYDLLGYTGLGVGRPPRWRYDPVHDREAPAGFWADVPYLDPSAGDHKVIWEINRHQHWLVLARAHHLAGDRRCYDEFVGQLEDWLAANPPLEGINWASMLELAFRSLSWLWALHLFAPAAVDEQEPAAPWMVDLLVGLDRQLAHVERNLSLYFSPNTHLSGEALALYVAGATLPELRASARWVALGRDVLVREASRQIRPDGGHAELSAHYHRYSTDFYLLALQVARASGDPAEGVLADALRRQARYLRTLADDTGRLPLVGDDDGGQLFPICGRPPADCRDTLATAAVVLGEPALAIGPAPEEVYWRTGHAPAAEALPAARTGWTSAVLADTGYCISRTGDGDHLLFDAGPHGFLNGGHAHSDALAIVATIGGVPLLVDPGTATYTMDPGARDRFRSTAMHNTVVVNGRSQSVPRGPFHWERTTDAFCSLARLGGGAEYFEGRHHGYAPIVHVRTVVALHGLAWFVVDHLLRSAGTEEDVPADAFWHLHPDWTLVSAPGPHVLLQHAGGRTHALGTSGSFAPVRGTEFEALGAYAPAYGQIERAECLRVSTAGSLPRSLVTVVPMAAGRTAALAVEPLALTEPAGAGWHAAAWRVRLDDVEAVLMCAVEADGVPSADLAAPPARWGTADFQIVGRAALLAANQSDHDAVVVNGRHLAAGAVRLNHDLSQPLIRSGGLPRRAPRPSPASRGLAPGGGPEEQDDVWNSRIR